MFKKKFKKNAGYKRLQDMDKKQQNEVMNSIYLKNVRKLTVEKLKLYQNSAIVHPVPHTPDEYYLSTVAMSEEFEKEELNKKDSEISQQNANRKLNVQRDVLTHEAVINQTGYVAADKSVLYAIKSCWLNFKISKCFEGIIPIVQWLPKYSFKNNLIGDIIAGITVAVMHIPQGMAYGLLAGVTANVGLYMAVFPALIYLLLGTSRHISIGTFAVVSIMTQLVVQEHAISEEDLNNGATGYLAIEVVTATAVTVGLIHLLMAALQLGMLASLLSPPLVNGFTTAAAVHVVVSQLKDLFGVTVVRKSGPFSIGFTIIETFKQMPNTNIAALIFSIVVIILMVVMNELIKPRIGKLCRFPLPTELFIVITATIVSKLMNVNENYNVKLVGDIPMGLPIPKFPPVSLFIKVLPDAIAIAIVSYSIVMSLAIMFAKKHLYEISNNQELFALGISNLVGGCFSCIPIACSLSRSVIQDQTGGKTQIASLVSAGLITAVLLWMGSFFNTLPRCALAGIIVVALKPLFMQSKQLKKFAKQGKLEALTWLVTFFGVVLIDIVTGLSVGIAMSLFTLYIKGLKPYSSLLGTLPDLETVYVDMKLHKNVVEVPNIKIFRYHGSINFATSSSYKRALYAEIKITSARLSEAKANPRKKITENYNKLILDFSGLDHLDVAGCSTLSEIMKDMDIIGVQICISSPSDKVYDTLVHSMALGEGPFQIFATLHDAVLFNTPTSIVNVSSSLISNSEEI